MNRMKLLVKAVMFSVLLCMLSIAVRGYSDTDNWKTPDSVLVKSLEVSPGEILFSHRAGRDTILNMSFLSDREDAGIRVYDFPVNGERQLTAGACIIIGRDTVDPVKTRMLWADDPGSILFNAQVTLPATAKSGFYLASMDGNESFSVKNSNAEKIALYCPEGFWSAVRQNGLTYSEEGVPYYFYVPSNLKNLEIFIGRPHTIKNSRGRTVLSASQENTGKMSIPVSGQGGIWSIEPAFYGSGKLGVCPPSFAKLINVEPIVSFGSSRRLPDLGKKAVWKKLQPEYTFGDTMEFVPGVSGNALRIHGDKTISFNRGQNVSQGGYACFPGKKGTIEFWLKTGWTSSEIPVSKNPFISRSFLKGPHINLNYLYGGKNWNRQVYSDLQIELLGDREIGLPKIGKQECYFFNSAQWIHLAYTWNIWKVSEAPPALPPGEMINGSVEWPSKWRIFGPLDSSDGILTPAILNSYPEKIEVGGKVLTGKDVSVENNLYDFPDMLKKEPTGKNAYVFLAFNSAREQEVTLGMGGDWWMQAWVNGKIALDTTETSNMYFPFSIWNHTVNVKVNKGKNVLAVRFIRGGGSELALGGPDQLKVTPLPPKPGEEKPKDGVEGEFNIFVNGKKLKDTRGLIREPFLASLGGWDIFSLSDKKEDITIGPIEGSVDMLRISDVIRYADNFVPEKTAPGMDKNTRALFLFDGNLKGISAFSKEPLEAR